MDSEVVTSSSDLLKCCNCGCICSLAAQSPRTWLRSIKRKHDEFELDSHFSVPGLECDPIARVEIENECAALREMVYSQQNTIRDLNAELEEERSAASTAANEAMSMILRLQREKAEVQMEARQFKRFAEERMSHDQEELLSLEDLLYKREQTIQSLTCEVQAYKHRMMSYGLTEDEVEGDPYELPTYEYPPLKCKVVNSAMDVDYEDTDIEKYAFGETPTDRLRNLESRISQMEKSSHYSQVDEEFAGKKVLEKVIVGQSPIMSRHSRKFSRDSASSGGMGREIGPDFVMDSPKVNGNFRKDYFSQLEDQSPLKKVDNASEGDDTTDRVCTIDSIHCAAAYNVYTESKSGACEDYGTTPNESGNNVDFEDPYIKKLYMRLQALEADRESMKQAIISMRTDKAQLILLKEIAQHLTKEISPQRQTKMRKSSITGRSSFGSILKWVTSVVLWRKRARESRYMLGLPAESMGLRMLLDKGTPARPQRCISSTQLVD